MAKRKRYSDEVKAKAKEMRKQGKTLVEVAEATGASIQSIMGWTGKRAKRNGKGGRKTNTLRLYQQLVDAIRIEERNRLESKFKKII